MAAKLNDRGIPARRLATSHAFHSRMMDPIIEPFTDISRAVPLSVRRQFPYISGVTGTWITAEEATDPAYWARHFREPVRFSTGCRDTARHPGNASSWKSGPGTTLCTLVRQHRDGVADPVVVASLPVATDDQSDRFRFATPRADSGCTA